MPFSHRSPLPILTAAALVFALCGAPPGAAAEKGRDRVAVESPKNVPLGAFLGSGAEGVARVEQFRQWLGAPVTVGRTYLPGNDWRYIEGPEQVLAPWARWKAADPRRMLVVNVPMMAPNETRAPVPVLASLLRRGAAGAFDVHYRTLAQRLAAYRAGDSVIVLGWEMNGQQYAGRCEPDPAAWRAYWRRIVTVMRGVRGARFRFDFAPARGRDVIPWTNCYPGDDVVDIIGTDTYDQPTGGTFTDFVNEPYGLRAQADFAAAHRKPISFPEWGLFRNNDNPAFVRGMHSWIMSHDVAYQSISDYCPHGVWACRRNPASTAAYRELFGTGPAAAPVPKAPPSAASASGASAASKSQSSKSQSKATPSKKRSSKHRSSKHRSSKQRSSGHRPPEHRWSRRAATSRVTEASSASVRPRS
ncbi:glycosyl hydrolase family 26 [Actinomadura syzygii]|uniref:Glycosyl hydrolase family 26 n=1 Tax=Actinomadura syzygii TaxID=1427538 RepID=A0A5D0UB67_9ACTN|nr:glycosyl hydrolase family 26 [Actinomadura syzygii]